MYRPNDRVVSDVWFQRSDSDEGRAGQLRASLPAQGKQTVSLSSPLGEIQVQFTIGGGHALVTASLAGRPLFSTVVLGDTNPAAGDDLARAFLASLRGTRPVLALAPAPAKAYGRILSATERPSVGSVLWPILPADQFATLGAIDVDCAAALVWSEPS